MKTNAKQNVAPCGTPFQNEMDSFTVSLHIINDRLLSAVRVVQGVSLSSYFENRWTFTLREPIRYCRLLITQCRWGVPQSMFGPANHRACNTSHVVYLTDSRMSIRLALCSSLGVGSTSIIEYQPTVNTRNCAFMNLGICERVYFDGLMQDCSISSALALEILQSCTKPSICSPAWQHGNGVLGNTVGAMMRSR